MRNYGRTKEATVLWGWQAWRIGSEDGHEKESVPGAGPAENSLNMEKAEKQKVLPMYE